MRFLSASIHDFRNISSAEVSIDAEDIVLTGINGQGKTNFLEAVYTLCYGSSFRTSHIRECVRNGSDGFSLSAYALDDKGIKERITVTAQKASITIKRRIPGVR